jgi:hypothetical protein
MWAIDKKIAAERRYGSKILELLQLRLRSLMPASIVQPSSNRSGKVKTTITALENNNQRFVNR